MTESEQLENFKHRYELACHAMQTGIAYKMNIQPAETSPKHLRVGVNSSMVENSALVGLLIGKGIITELEFYHALCVAMEHEAETYQTWVGTYIGKNVKLF